MNFQDWLLEKKVHDQHLVFANALKTKDQKQAFESLAYKMANLSPSQSLGLQFLELITDLILMDKTHLILEESKDFNCWLQHIKELRYPQTLSRDQNLKEKLEKLNWPSGSKTKFERRGDRAGVELKTFISSSLDIKKLAAELERLEKEFPR